MEFKEFKPWEGEDKETSVIAEFSLEFETIENHRHWAFRLRKNILLRRLRKQLQQIADEKWGKKKTKVKATRISEGSIEVFFVLLAAAGGAVWKFFKDYPSFKKGIIEFKKDIYDFKRKIENRRYELEPLANRYYYRRRYRDELIGAQLEQENKVKRILNISFLHFIMWLVIPAMINFFVLLLGLLFIEVFNWDSEIFGIIFNSIHFIILAIWFLGYYFVSAIEAYGTYELTGVYISSLLAGIFILTSTYIWESTPFFEPPPEEIKYIVYFFAPITIILSKVPIYFRFGLALLFLILTAIGNLLS